MKAFYIPNGPKNIIADFPSVLFSNIAEYYVKVIDVADNVIATSTINNLEHANCCEDKVRLHFLNYSSAVDCINLTLLLSEHETKSDVSIKALNHPLDKSIHSINRVNVKASDTLTLSTIEYSEINQDWLTELVDSPLVFMEWKGIQGQPDSYLPVVILDTKIITKKKEDRYEYELILQIKLSHERHIIRN